MVLCLRLVLTKSGPLPPGHAFTHTLHEASGKHQPGKQVLESKLYGCEQQGGCGSKKGRAQQLSSCVGVRHRRWSQPRRPVVAGHTRAATWHALLVNKRP